MVNQVKTRLVNHTQDVIFKRIHTYNTTISEFLKCHPGPYSHFILLDHQDWLAWHDPQALEQEWRLILANSRAGSKILM